MEASFFALSWADRAAIVASRGWIMRKSWFVCGLLLIGTVSCSCLAATDPFDDMSSVAVADRPALQACLAATDLPGNHWPVRAGKARCWLSLPQSPSLGEIAVLLKAPHGAAKLDRRYAEILAADYADPAHRETLFRAYQDFGTDVGQRVAQEWLRKSPKSVFAQMARGDAALGAAWKFRGSQYADKTTSVQFTAMAEQLKIAVPILLAVLRVEPKLSPACVDLMQIGNMIGDPGLSESATQHCMKVDPFSLHVNDMWLTGFDPRWGGSFDELDRAVQQIRLREPKSPMLASLLSKGIGRRAYMSLEDNSRLLPIAVQLDQAAVTAPDAFYLDKAGVAADQAGNYREARDYFAQALRFAPNAADFLIDQASWLARTGDHAHAMANVQLAQAQPDDCGCKDHASIAAVLLELNQLAPARVELHKALQKPDQRLWAMTRLCQTYFMAGFDRDGGLSCTKQFVEEFPDNSEALYLRALALYIVHDPGAKEFDARFRKHADMSNEGQRSEIEQLNQFIQPDQHAIPH